MPWSISQTKDTRSNGISHETKLALTAQHLRVNSPGQNVADFITSGPKHLVLDYRDAIATDQTDAFLQEILDWGVSQGSTWEISTRGQRDCLGNMTLLSEFITSVPQVTDMHWRMR